MKKTKQNSALVSFGNYLLGDERKKLFASHPEPGTMPLEERLSQVHDADLANWKEINNSNNN